MSSVYLIGDGVQAAHVSTILNISVGTATSAGDVINVAAGTGANSMTVTSVTDTKGNNYSLRTSDVSSTSGQNAFLWVADATNNTGGTTALALFDVITINWTSSAGGQQGIVFGINGTTAAPLDSTPAGTANASSTTPSIASGSLAQANEVVVGVVSYAHAGSTMTWAGGWTSILDLAGSGSTGSYLAVAYKTVSSTSSVTATGTISAAPWTAILASYELSGALTINTTSLTSARQNIAYEETVNASGGAGAPYTWSLTTGSLPAGLSLDASSGQITGTPTGTGTSPFTVQVKDSDNATATKSLRISVNGLGEPYFLTSFSGAPSADLTPSATLSNNIFDGDTIHVGVLATAGSVSGVTDSAGNTYTLLRSETANPGCQIYHFASYSSALFNFSQTQPNAGLFGATVDAGQYSGTNHSDYAAANIFDGIVGGNWAVAGTKRFPNAKGGLPVGVFPAGPSSDELKYIKAGCQLWLCWKPDVTVTTAQKNAITASLTAYQNACTAAGSGASIVLAPWNEPQDGANSTYFPNGASDFITMMQNLYATVNATGVKMAYVSHGSGGPSDVTNWFPGSAYCDIVGLDYYCNSFVHNDGSTGATLNAAVQLADNNSKPFALAEFGSSSGTNPPAKSDFENYISVIQDTLTGRLTAGKTNAAVMWFNGPNGGLNEIQSSSDYRVALLQGLQQAITSAPPPTVTVTYTSTSSMQGFVVVGDNGVAANGDIAVAAAGTSTAPSVSTGTLATNEEHLITFIANLAAGGSPSLTDSLTSIGQVEAATTAFLTAAWKPTTSTTADTPSATITSTTWAITAATDPLPPVNLQLIASFANGFTGVAYSQTCTATGGVAPYNYSVISGSLPPGLTLTPSTGIISGTPTATGTYNFELQVQDSQGDTGTANQSITIVQGGPAGVHAVSLAANHLTRADSQFEISGFTWAASLNANAPALTTLVSFTGNQALSWTSTVTGNTSIATAMYPVIGGAPYICSAIVFPGGSARTAWVGMQWYDNTSTLIGTSSGPVMAVQGGQWNPLQAAVTAPATAVNAEVFVEMGDVAVGEMTVIDMAFMTQSGAQVLIDWVNPPFEQSSMAGNAFMDVSPWVRMDVGITTGRGRQDAISEIQPGTGGFTLQNDLGPWTPGATGEIPAALGGSTSLQYRCQVNFTDENGVWYTRADGPISAINYTLDPTGNTSEAAISITDVTSSMNRQDQLFCWTKEQALANGPLYHWSLDDSGASGGAGVAAETSGNNGPAMRVANSDSTNTATLTWQDTSSGVETLADAVSPSAPDGSGFWLPGYRQPTSALRGLVSGTTGPFTTPIGSVLLNPAGLPAGLTGVWPAGTQTAQNTFVGTNGYYLEAELPTPIAPTLLGANYALECWFTMDPSIGANDSKFYGPFIAIGLGSSRTKTNLVAGLFLNGGALNFECANYSQPPAFLGLNWPGAAAPTATASTSAAMTADKVKVPHHLVINFTGDSVAPAVSVYVDGAQIGSGFTLPTGQTYDTLVVGSAYGGCGSWFGNLSLVSVYPFTLGQSLINLDCQLGQYGMWETSADDCIAQLSAYANIPSFWNNLSSAHTSLAVTDYVDITGSNALSMMQQFEQAERGLLYVDALGTLNFHPRSWRMGYGAPDVYLPPDTFDANLQYELVDQFQCNEEAVSGPNTLGATATTTLTNTSTGATQTQTTTSTLIQAGYINQASQNQYGVYATNPVSAPISLPLVTWSRAYAALGLPSFSYWPDPNLSDRAAWEANSRAQPWFLPATLTFDLLTLDTNAGIGISTLYGLEIDNMVAPSGTLPNSFPVPPGAVEWFIEGVQETYTQTSRTLQFFTSPAATQRAWIPGDATYGVLGSTARIGISASDVSIPQADGKDVSHDAGGPYWPPNFAPTMNNLSGESGGSSGEGGFVGASDIRGIASNFALLLQPPMCVVSALSQTQSVNNGALTGSSPPGQADILWDIVHVDTAGSFGLVPGWPNWYVCTVPGFYELDASLCWSLTGSGLSGYTGQAWFVVAQAAAQAVTGGTGTPRSVNQYVCPVGEAVRFNASSMTPVCCPTTRMYLGLGDMVALAVEQNYTSSRGTSTAGAGSSMSIRFTGLATADDRTEINSLISTGGTVSLVAQGQRQTATFSNSHTYSYQGTKGWGPNERRNADEGIHQGVEGGGSEGSGAGQIAFNVASIQSALSGHTVLSATLTGSNQSTHYTTGAKLMLGTTKDTPGGSTFDADDSHTTNDIVVQKFTTGQTLTFSVPLQVINNLNTGGAKALVLGDSDTDNLDYSGVWNGGPGSWTLTVVYV